jgi:hypothetical protein
MLFAEKTRIEEYVVEILDNGSLDGPTLLKKLRLALPNITKQALYKALRKLLKNEVLNKTGGVYSLNRTWLQKVREFSNRHIKETKAVDIINVLNFEDGESVTYRFKNPFLLDITWGHLYDIIFEANERYWVMLNHHPHEWLMLSRPETERFWLNQINKERKMMLFTISGSTLLDKKFKSEWSSDYVKINLGESYNLKPNQYLSVVGDFVFEITTDPEFEKEVNSFFNKNKTIDELAQKQIQAISKKKYKSKLKLSKNKRKADMWRKKYKKDFYIPKPYYL